MIGQLPGGLYGEITYFYIDDTTKHGFIIDPGTSIEAILQVTQENGWTIEKVLLTHGHIDHILSATKVREALGVKIVIHTEGKKYIQDPNWNLSIDLPEEIIFEADQYVEHGDEIVLEANPEFKVRVIHAPGHTADGVAYYSEKDQACFVGDIIFAGGVGRSDLPGGNSMRLLSAIRSQIFTLPGETNLLPGHGPVTTVTQEKTTSPIFNFYD